MAREAPCRSSRTDGSRGLPDGITDEMLCEAIKRADRGLVDANLGGELIKQRIARIGEGARGGFRAFVAYRKKHRAVFLFAIKKSAEANIDDDEEDGYKKLASLALGYSTTEVEKALTGKALFEVKCDDKKV